ncbi:MAG: phosphatase PAP2 family protein [Prevotella sp.]|nr:phosphatase PAP2 family protein [Prevotella sp.]
MKTANQAWKPDFDFFKSKTNPGVKPYKFMDDMTFVGVPLFAAGWALKSDKAMFRVNQKVENGGKKNTQLLSDFKTGVDDYLQFFGPAAVVGLKLGGVEGRSDWPRLLASAALSYGIMAGFVNGIKYTAKEMRPDGSTANSWPSGHTATSFVGATLLHKEYGLTRSPWFSVAGYGAATATGVMRVLNNRHWVSDVMSGAGIGILSTELGYAIGDLLFKGKGLLRNDLGINSEKPSFFSISMGLGIGNKSIDFNGADVIGYEGAKIEADEDDQIQFRAATVVDAEGAYFFNKYVGVGGRLRVRAMSAKSFGKYSEYLLMEDWNAWEGMIPSYEYCYPERFDKSTEIENYFQFLNDIGYKDTEDALKANAPVTDIHGVVKSDHLAEFTGSLGLYFNLPLGSHFALGTKALIGRSFTQELDIDGYAEGNKKDIDYIITMQNINGEAIKDLAYLDYPTNTGEKWTDEWDYLTLGAKSSTSFGTGLSLTYKYKSNFSWRLYCDYDYTEKDFTLKYDPYHFMKTGVTDATYALMQQASINDFLLEPIEFKKTKKMNYFTLGLAFLVNF